jgi:hypothetical protein
LTRALRALLSIAAAFAAAIVVSAPVAAHSGEYGLFADPLRSWPGGVLTVRGDLSSTGPIELVMVADGSPDVLILTVDDAPNGHFETTATIPADLAPGAWTLQARATGMPTIGTAITLTAPPQPDDDDAVPSASSAVASGAVASPIAAADRAPTIPYTAPPSTGAAGFDLVPVVAVGLAIGALAVLLLRTRRRSEG